MRGPITYYSIMDVSRFKVVYLEFMSWAAAFVLVMHSHLPRWACISRGGRNVTPHSMLKCSSGTNHHQIIRLLAISSDRRQDVANDHY
jgi:hypothetical protein